MFFTILGTSLMAQHVKFVEPDGGGAHIFENGPCLSPSQRMVIQQEIKRNSLRINPDQTFSEAQESFIWPIKQADGFNYNGIDAISNYVDQDVAYPGLLLDYDCGSRTYDLASGYNHKGTDIFTWPFGWNMVTYEQAEVVAAAAGTIVYKTDGNSDRNCDFSNPNWNAIFIEHSDGSESWYGHMKKNSLTTKGVGETVQAGEYLGIVASSGSSTGPHLHFEIYDNNNDLIDPYAGACNSLNPTSWWANQEPYFNSRLNAALTHILRPDMSPPCPQDDIINDSNCFVPGTTVFFAAYYRDQLSGQNSVYKILKPDNSVWETWSHSPTNAHLSASWWYWTRTLPADATFGTWKFEVAYEGEIVTHEFKVDDDCTPVVTTGISETTLPYIALFPNPGDGMMNLTSGEMLEEVTIRITNLQGQLVFNGEYERTQHISIDQSALAPGIYLVDLTTTNFQQQVKFVKK